MNNRSGGGRVLLFRAYGSIRHWREIIKKIMKKKLFKLSGWTVGVGALATPLFVFAQSTCIGSGTLSYMICKIANLINAVIPMLIALGVVYFIYGVISYAIAKDEEAKTAGRGAMIMGLIALLVIVSIWGLVNLLRREFGITSNNSIDVPCIPNPNLGVFC
jgi:uncharacterized membrane protein